MVQTDKNPGNENFKHDFEAKTKVTSDEAWLTMLNTENTKWRQTAVFHRKCFPCSAAYFYFLEKKRQNALNIYMGKQLK